MSCTCVKSVDTSYVKVTVPNPADSTALTLAPQQVVYTITVTNTGTAPATNVKVTDSLPAGMSFVSATLARSTGTDAGGVTTYGTPSSLSSTTASPNLTFDVGSLSNLEPGRSAQIRVTAAPTVVANTTQNAYLNTAKSSATLVNEVSSEEVRTDVVYTRLFKQVHNLGSNPPAGVPQSSPAWVSIGKGLPGDVLEYCIDFYNYGSVPLNNYKVTDVVPLNTAYVSGSAVIKTGSMTAPGSTFTPGSVTYDTATNSVIASGMTVPAAGGGTLCFRARIR
ncbi:hypothetical protein ACINK0_03995 [Deinococcus sp. VB343]|uniref:hypothetical protein n=1 Tax=Deinococcus sp. VB343 TaxID=3385567 RepID=UPI0039C9E2C0